MQHNEPVARVFLDTNVLKASRDTDLVLMPREKKIQWGPVETKVVVHDMVYENQNAKYRERNNETTYLDTLHDRLVARLAFDKHLELLVSNEVIFESWGLPRVGSFFGAPITIVDSPIPHAGLVIDGSGTDYLYRSLKQIDHPRFTQLQKVSAAYRNESSKRHRNQLLDAFHLWTAESCGADYFLTHESKLISQCANNDLYDSALKPTNTVPLLKEVSAKKLSLLWPILSEAWKIHKSKRDIGRKYQSYHDLDDETRDTFER